MKKMLLLLLICTSLHSKVLLMTHSYNRPEFIELHAKTFQAFLQDEYEYVVFNDAPNEAMSNRIEKTCQQLNIRCFRIPQQLHKRGDAGQRHMDGIGYALEKIGYDHDGILVLVDSDAFLIKSFSIEKYLEGYDIAGELQGKSNGTTEVRYISPVLAFMNMQRLPNHRTLSFYGGHVENVACDVGGHMYYYFRDNPSIKQLNFGAIHVGTWQLGNGCKKCSRLSCHDCTKRLKDHGLDEAAITFVRECPDYNVEFLLNGTFLHYRGGSNWDHKSNNYHIIKSKALERLMSTILGA